MKKIQAKYIGTNDFSMPIAQDEKGRYYCDVDLGGLTPDWHTMTVVNLDTYDGGEPLESLSKLGVELEVEGLPESNRFREQYMLLDRMLSDVKYYINMGGNGSCWTNSNKQQDGINDMRKLWEIFPYDAKPEWCTMDTIDAAEFVMLHTDLKGIWHKWKGCDKTLACKLVLQLMDTSFFNNNYCKALDFVHQLYSYMDREDLEVELNKYI